MRSLFRLFTRQPLAAKVPEITVMFWVVKILTTASGEAISDYLSTGNKAVGAPIITSEGLSCSDSDSHSGEHGGPGNLQLKAGSRHHQHLVLFKDGSGSQTHFSLIALDLPHGFETEQRGTN